jgi:hypothetical protein
LPFTQLLDGQKVFQVLQKWPPKQPNGLVGLGLRVRLLFPMKEKEETIRILRRPPPKPPLFGIRIHPVVGIIAVLFLVAVRFLIACASNPNFLPKVNPFSSAIPTPSPTP